MLPEIKIFSHEKKKKKKKFYKIETLNLNWSAYNAIIRLQKVNLKEHLLFFLTIQTEPPHLNLIEKDHVTALKKHTPIKEVVMAQIPVQNDSQLLTNSKGIRPTKIGIADAN